MLDFHKLAKPIILFLMTTISEIRTLGKKSILPVMSTSSLLTNIYIVAAQIIESATAPHPTQPSHTQTAIFNN